MSDEKKIIIDEDWKNQAQKEKEALKEKEQAEKDHPETPQQMPEADFAGLVSMLATQAFYALGLIRPDGEEGEPMPPNFPIAKYNIDTLATLEEKTKGNLTEDEASMLKETLSQLRMLFVQLSQDAQQG